MGKFDDILLITDMDGTLLNSKSELSEGNISAIKYFIQNGGTFTFATGRNPETIEKFQKATGVNAPAILYNGGLLYDFSTKETVKRVDVDESALDILRIIAEKYPEIAIEIHKDSEIYQYHENLYSDIHLKVVEFIPHHLNELSDVPFPWNKVGFWFDCDKFDEFKGFVTNIINDKLCFVRSHAYSAEILSAKADKGIMLAQLKKLYGDKKIVACGDNENDLLMLKNADISYAPANAFPCAKEIATFVLENDCDADFVAKVIEDLM